MKYVNHYIFLLVFSVSSAVFLNFILKKKTLYFNYNKSTLISNEISSVRIEISIDYKEMLILKQLILEMFSIEYIYSKTVEI